MTTIPPALERWRLQWRHRPRREQRFFIAFVALVVIALLWLGLWLPLTQHVQQLQRDLPPARAQLEQAQQQLSESIGLNRQMTTSAPTPATADARAAITRTAAPFHLAAAVVALDVQQNTVSLTFSAVSFDTLVQWLDALQRDEHFYVTTATLTPLTASGKNAGQLRAELVLVRPSP
ncbi:MAG: type II secretion system protein M [Betaproteobacteria bacterium]|nr:type II secretion system protein M [Betaproteobacteria bacterium]